MKEIKAIIQPHIVSKVIRALHGLDRFPGFTLLDVRGQGRGCGKGGSYKVTEDDIDYHRKAMIVVICSDEPAAIVTQVIRSAAHTGNKGDGIIVVSEVAEVIRIRTGEIRDSAL